MAITTTNFHHEMELYQAIQEKIKNVLNKKKLPSLNSSYLLVESIGNNFLALNKMNIVKDNLYLIPDKNNFVRAEGQGIGIL